MTEAAVERIRRWHERAYAAMRSVGMHRVSYLGLNLVVPTQVFAPAQASMIMGRAVLTEVRPEDRVLDVGTGSGVNAILAASRASSVLGIDSNPYAIGCARDNAVRNGFGQRCEFRQSDLFEQVSEAFDLIIFDPPFRWFKPRDLLETAISDDNYGTLRRFFDQVCVRLRPGGRVLLFFGDTGDLRFLHELVANHGLTETTIATWQLREEGRRADYFVFRLTCSAQRNRAPRGRQEPPR